MIYFSFRSGLWKRDWFYHIKLVLSLAVVALVVTAFRISAMLKFTVIIGMQYLYNSQTLSDIISMCLYRNAKENELYLWSKKMVSIDKTFEKLEQRFVVRSEIFSIQLVSHN